ncbi:MAG: polysaccharide biosynthesis protein [Clostridia bacterium]|nr:polysaccharide biosynthesis protein [Clostridia bacterium]MBR3553868.1 polysaccharide biosynthesis protein [Clostridia bacterium]
MENRKKQNFLTGAGVLAIATILVKIIGILYKFPLVRLISTEGYAYFQGAYEIYNPLYAISMAGLPIAVSKLVSQNVQAGRMRDAQNIFRVSRRLFLTVGAVGTVLLLSIAVPYSLFVHSSMNYISILVVAPCILFCCQMSSFRGYYEGLKNMTPTGVSQVIEAVIKLVVGLAATYVFVNRCETYYDTHNIDGFLHFFGVDVYNHNQFLAAIYPYSAAVAISGVTLGSMAGLLFLFLHNKRKGFGFTREELVNSPPPQSDRTLRNQIIRIAAPVALTSVILNLSNIIDAVTIRRRLADVVETSLATIKGLYGECFLASGTLDSSINQYLYGAHGTVLNLRNLIPTITLTLGISAIPVLSAAWQRKDHREIKTTIESALRICMTIALPAGLGMAALAEPILRLLYPSEAHSLPITVPLLLMYGPFVFLFSTTSPVTNMLQAVGRMDVPIKSIIVGSVLKVGLNYVLVGIPRVNIHGAPISTALMYAVMLAINLTMLLRVTKVKINFVSVFLKPFIAAAVCGGTAWGSYYAMTHVLSLNAKLSTLAAIVVGGGFYVVVLLFVKGIAKDDVEMLPKGEKIAKALAKFKLLG